MQADLSLDMQQSAYHSAMKASRYVGLGGLDGIYFDFFTTLVNEDNDRTCYVYEEGIKRSYK
jgi:hypothetical protein